jgi:hypothetical protein
MSLVWADDFADLIFATPETVDQVLAAFARTEGMPEDVASLLDLAHKLLRTSVVHYEFAALAAEKSLQALERAVRMRLGVDDRAPFKQLIDRLAKEVELSDEDRDMLDTGREIRNFFAHPSTAPAFPLVVATGMLRTSHRLIATLFPDPDERAGLD